MRVYAIGDLHLSGSQDKDMDIFGSAWFNHADRIERNWRSKITSDDLVLIPGDISWACRLEEARTDLEWIDSLPGHKILVRGNHDYWWSAPGQVRRALPPSIEIIQNDAVRCGEIVVCGTRGWVFPVGGPLSEQDRKIYDREQIRLRMSLDRARAMKPGILIVMLHYPPLYENVYDTAFVEILEEYSPDHVVFGHLHGKVLDQLRLRNLVRNGITYDLVSSDYIEFDPLQLKIDRQDDVCSVQAEHA